MWAPEFAYPGVGPGPTLTPGGSLSYWVTPLKLWLPCLCDTAVVTPTHPLALLRPVEREFAKSECGARTAPEVTVGCRGAAHTPYYGAAAVLASWGFVEFPPLRMWRSIDYTCQGHWLLFYFINVFIMKNLKPIKR